MLALSMALAACVREPAKPEVEPPDCVPVAETPYDGIDQDCDGADLTDVDGDGYAGIEDCDDTDADVFPGAEEACDGVDNDCDGEIDVRPTWYADDDGDGYGDASAPVVDCSPRPDVVAEAGDCDDADADVLPGAVEACDGVDNDCDGMVPADEADADGDGVRVCAGDCDDADVFRKPGGFERCDGRDDDCDAEVDEACLACDLAVPTDHPAIQAAIDAASDGDVVCVEAGTYAECVDFGGKEIELVGIEGAGATILSGDFDCAPVVRFAAAEGPAAVLQGLTLQYGKGDTGAGIGIDGASPTIQDVVVVGNFTQGVDGRGAGIYVRGGAPTLRRLFVSENGADGGGYDGFGYGYGGGLYLEDTDAIIEDLWAVDNGAGDGGGGLALVRSSAVVVNAWLDSNAANQVGGGGVYVDGGAPTFTNVRITENVANSGWGYGPEGGGVLVEGGATPTFTNVLVEGNYAESGGAGLAVLDGHVVLVNAIVAENDAGESAGGVLGVVTLAYSDVWGNTPDDLPDMDDPAGTDGNVSVDPLTRWGGHLQADSPLVDAGDPSIVDPDGSRSDIGAFGGPGAGGYDLDSDGWPAWWLPGAYDAATSAGMDCDDDDATVYPGAGC